MTNIRPDRIDLGDDRSARAPLPEVTDLLAGLGDREARWLLASLENPSRTVLSLSEQIADKVAIRIIRGEYSPGERFMEMGLADEFQVSRGPIREALRILEREGLVVIQPRRGARVQELSPKDVRDIFEVRANLLAQLAANIASDPLPKTLKFFDAIAEALARAHRSDNLDGFVDLIYRATMYVCEIGGNELARKILISLSRQTLAFTRQALRDPANQQMWIDDWARFVRGVREADPKGAGDAMHTLVNHVEIAVLTMMEGESPAAPYAGDGEVSTSGTSDS